MYANVTSTRKPYHGLKFRAHPGGNTTFDTVTSLQQTAYIFDIGHQCYGQLTPVKTRYPLTGIT